MLKVAKIRNSATDNLMISEDTGSDNEPIAVFLYTPTMSKTIDHFHIEMDVGQARVAYEWLGQFLEKYGKEG